MPADRSHAMDHVVLVLFENRSLDNLLGHLYGPEDGKTFFQKGSGEQRFIFANQGSMHFRSSFAAAANAETYTRAP